MDATLDMGRRRQLGFQKHGFSAPAYISQITASQADQPRPSGGRGAVGKDNGLRQYNSKSQPSSLANVRLLPSRKLSPFLNGRQK